MISGMLRASLTNFQQAMSIKCLTSSTEAAEESVGLAVVLVGKTEHILKILDHKALASLEPYQMACITILSSATKS